MRSRSPRKRLDCFVLMPFRPDLRDVFEVVRTTAKSLGYKCWRADERLQAGNVLRLILADIDSADVVIADLTGQNPNVFYEVAFAHMRKEARRVILMAQRDEDVPFDLRALRYLKYENSLSGRLTLRAPLRGFLREAMQSHPGEPFESIEGKIERTRRIVADLKVLLNSGPHEIRATTVRAMGGLSCLAISDEELLGARGPEAEYRRLLLEERNSLRELLRHGATLKSVVSPPTEAFKTLGYLFPRLRRLLAVLRGGSADPDDRCLLMRRCQVVLSPVRPETLYIFGTAVYYAGVKTGLGGGFDLTTRVTDRTLIDAHINAFDSFFREARRFTLERYGATKPGADAAALRAAVVRGLCSIERKLVRPQRTVRR